MKHLKQNYKNYLVVITILTIFILGTLARPFIDKTFSTINDFFKPKTITYQAEKISSDEEKAINEIMKRDEFVQAINSRAKWIYYNEKSNDLLKQQEKYSAMSLVEAGRFSGKNNELLDSWTDNTKIK